LELFWNIFGFLSSITIITVAQAILLFILGAFSFDCVHYILHVWENSRFRFLRFLGGLHAVHHEFLDREMRIQRPYSRSNLLNHVVPEYLTGIAGSALLAVLFGWISAGILVVAVRTLMVIAYLLQKGEDFTHKPVSRIRADRSLIFVGPAYHALHHVYVRQHYSSFINIFDLIFGTNCQIAERKFLIVANDEIGIAMRLLLEANGAIVDIAEPGELMLAEKMSRAEVLIISDASSRNELIAKFVELGKQRLMPPEVWNLGGPRMSNRFKTDLIYRYAAFSPAHSSPKWVSLIALFFFRRGFRAIRLF
jgi:hypothetical protein